MDDLYYSSGSGLCEVLLLAAGLRGGKMRRMVCVLVLMSCISLAVMPAGASDYMLGIFGNANMDDTIDEDDIAYVEGIIDGTNERTELADANYDSEIDEEDITQIEQIIRGEEEELTLIDMIDRTVTVPRPIERVVSGPPDPTRLIVALGEGNKLVGINSYGSTCLCYNSPEVAPICAAEVCGGKLFELPVVGWCVSIDNAELTLSLEPDVIFAYGASSTYSDAANTLQEQTGIPVVCVKSGGHKFEELYEAAELLGIILTKEDEAQEIVTFVQEKIDEVGEVTSEIPDDEKPTVYFASRGVEPSAYFGGVTTTTNFYEPLDIAGGINVAKDCGTSPGAAVDVSKEQIIAWNPDIIIVAHSFDTPLDEVNDVEVILSDPDLQTLDAVKNHRVYFSMYPYCCGTPQDRNLANMMYLAKLFHPEEFEDLDVEEEGNEIYEKFLGVDGLFTEYADATIWLREWLDSQ